MRSRRRDGRPATLWTTPPTTSTRPTPRPTLRPTPPGPTGTTLKPAIPRRATPKTFEELLESQRSCAVPRCAHCGRDTIDRRAHEMAVEALRTRIRVLESAWEIETRLAAKA